VGSTSFKFFKIESSLFKIINVGSSLFNLFNTGSALFKLFYIYFKYIFDIWSVVVQSIQNGVSAVHFIRYWGRCSNVQHGVSVFQFIQYGVSILQCIQYMGSAFVQFIHSRVSVLQSIQYGVSNFQFIQYGVSVVQFIRYGGSCLSSDCLNKKIAISKGEKLLVDTEYKQFSLWIHYYLGALALLMKKKTAPFTIQKAFSTVVDN
jgi:hypothetical protein